MRFCPDCQSKMTKTTTNIGLIEYRCRCGKSIEGQPNDTLMAEGREELEETSLKHEVFIQQSPYDPAGAVVHKDCPKCGLNFLTLVRVGINEQTIYTCSCGYRATHEDYMKDYSTQDIQKVQNNI